MRKKIAYLAIIDITAEAAETRHVFEVCENWIQLGYKVDLFVPYVSGNPSQYLFTKVTKVKTFGLKPGFMLTLVYNIAVIFSLLQHCFSDGIDMVYTRHSMLEFLPMLCLLPFGVRYVMEINGLSSEQKSLYGLPQWAIRLSGWFDGICYRLSDFIIAVTDQIRDLLIYKYPIPQQKIFVISNGANIEVSRPIKKEIACTELGLDPEDIYLVFVGSLKKWHGIENAILALKALINYYTRLKLLVVGDGPELSYLRGLIEKEDLGDRVVFVGKVKYTIVPLYIGAASLSLAPFNTKRNDPTGLSPLKIFEYMACASPIIATRVGGLEKIVAGHKCGLVVEPDNPDALVQGIAKLLSDSNLSEELGRNGRRAVEMFYSWSKISQRILTAVE